MLRRPLPDSRTFNYYCCEHTMVGYVQDAIVLLGDSLTQGGTIPYGFAQQLTGMYK
jgi:hypothetical protein